jgi:valyl-tRNA synthetase
LIDVEKEHQKVQSRLNKLDKQIDQLSKKLSGPFSKRAPSELVEKEKEKFSELNDKKAQLEEQLQILT